jgi:predicted RNase H-like nuclease (RuvC/YqgF family)
MTQSMILGTSKKTNFDEALKQHLHENDELRNVIKEKNHDIFELRGQVDELRRLMQTQRNERDL